MTPPPRIQCKVTSNFPIKKERVWADLRPWWVSRSPRLKAFSRPRPGRWAVSFFGVVWRPLPVTSYSNVRRPFPGACCAGPPTAPFLISHPKNVPVERAVLFLLYRWGNRGLYRLDNLPKVAEPGFKPSPMEVSSTHASASTPLVPLLRLCSIFPLKRLIHSKYTVERMLMAVFNTIGRPRLGHQWLAQGHRSSKSRAPARRARLLPRRTAAHEARDGLLPGAAFIRERSWEAAVFPARRPPSMLGPLWEGGRKGLRDKENTFSAHGALTSWSRLDSTDVVQLSLVCVCVWRSEWVNACMNEWSGLETRVRTNGRGRAGQGWLGRRTTQRLTSF